MSATDQNPPAVLVTGASGFIGRHVLPELVARGYAVHAVWHRREAPDMAGVTWHRADLWDVSESDTLIRDLTPTHLVHLAWCTSPNELWTSPDNLTWVSATLTLLRQFIAAGGRRFVVAGSCAEYDWRYGHCVEELTPLAPSTMYGAAKHATHLLARELAAQHGVSCAWARLFFLFGPHEHPSRLVPVVVRGLLARQSVPCSRGTQVRDFLHVADAGSALAALLDSRAAGPVNIASGQGVAVRDIVRAIASRFEGPDLVNFGAIDRPEAAAVVANVDRLREIVQWTPRYSLEEGLTETIHWWLRQSPEAPIGRGHRSGL